jgi:hypothetical protein
MSSANGPARYQRRHGPSRSSEATAALEIKNIDEDV